ncbi:Protein FAM50A [Dirofilaria immitis]|nr:Protein FAM50A [Dirofilaria immitis]
MSKADEGRLIHIAKKRERAKEAIEQRRRKLEEETKNLKTGITTKFTANYDVIEDSLKTSTVGLVTLDEMREKQRDVVEARELQRAVEGNSKENIRNTASDSKSCQKRVLSFAFDDEDEEDMVSVPLEKKRVGMDPTVETAFLPDRNREKELAKLKEDLAKEWQSPERSENEKGNTISQFLVRALELLKREFSETRAAVPESLMFVKEDLIIPHFYTFQDFIVTKAMGKTGPLYEFDAAGEIRLRQDAAVDCGESHPAKVVLRSWYEKNKHIYPASRWEAFVPNKEYRRTIDDLTTI